MNLIILLVVGGIIGWLASIIMRTDAQQGIVLNIVVGIVGALLAGFVLTPLIGGVPITSGSLSHPSVAARRGRAARNRQLGPPRQRPLIIRGRAPIAALDCSPPRIASTALPVRILRGIYMKGYIIVAAAGLLATGAVAQDAQSGSHNPALKDSSVHKVAAPAKGHSSFTESQAKGRIAKAGYTGVGDLKKTDAGIWQGSATKDGKNVTVSLDYKGNVTAR
jgi:uncharacterized membrane protein YeaQ/YmgE (transglycosylase-associated protein family)